MKNKPTLKIDEFGNQTWYYNGKYHREDGPAIEYADGGKGWYLNDKLHRIDGPAVEHANGYKAWYLNGKLHRTDGPAIERSDGTKIWFLNGEEVKKEDIIDINPKITEREYIKFVINQ